MHTHLSISSRHKFTTSAASSTIPIRRSTATKNMPLSSHILRTEGNTSEWSRNLSRAKSVSVALTYTRIGGGQHMRRWSNEPTVCMCVYVCMYVYRAACAKMISYQVVK